MKAVAEATGLVIGYGKEPVLGPLDFRVTPGVTALLGRNGTGKTTLMRTLCGVIDPLSGVCRVLGETVRDGCPARSRIGYLGHDSALANRLTVAQNLSFWRRVVSTYPDVVIRSENELIEQFDLADLGGRKVNTLSRGQRQRVDLARVAMTDPSFVVLDEPLTGLDPVYASQTRALLAQWGEKRSVIYSTHSIPEALELADNFLVVHSEGVTGIGASGEDTGTRILEILESHS